MLQLKLWALILTRPHELVNRKKWLWNKRDARNEKTDKISKPANFEATDV